MPYIPEKDRFNIDHMKIAKTSGELNYSLTILCQEYHNDQAIFGNKGGYTIFNEIIGALEACKLEFYRRMVSPYEDQKIKENGDVY